MAQNPNTSLHCGICLEKYSLHSLPVSLPQCGHTLCRDCAQTIGAKLSRPPLCPFCKQVFPILREGGYLKPQTNYALLGVIQEAYSFGLCVRHCLPFEYLCINEKQYACSKCCIFGKHQAHKVIELDEVKKHRDRCLSLIEDAYTEVKACLSKLISELNKSEKETLQIAKEVFNEVKCINNKQKSEWETRITQSYEEEKLRLIMEAALDLSVERKLERRLDEYKAMPIEDLYFISKDHIQKCVVDSGNEVRCNNSVNYCAALRRVDEQLNKSVIEHSFNDVNVLFPSLMFPRDGFGFPFGNKRENFISNLSFEFYGTHIDITLRCNRTKGIFIKNAHNWTQTQTVRLNVMNTLMSDDDFELLKIFLDYLNQMKTLKIIFDSEITASSNLNCYFQNHITKLMSIFLTNTRKLAHLSLIWNGSLGADIVLKYLKDQMLSRLKLEVLDIDMPNLKIEAMEVSILNMYGFSTTSQKRFNSEEIKELLKSFKGKGV